MKKLLLLPTILVLVSCQPSELDRCIKANMLELNETERGNITIKILKSYKVVLPDEINDIEFRKIDLSTGRFVVPYMQTVLDLSQEHKFYDRLTADQIDEWFANRDYAKLLKMHKNVYDYNIEYYGLSDGVDSEAYYKKTATSICTSQGIY